GKRGFGALVTKSQPPRVLVFALKFLVAAQPTKHSPGMTAASSPPILTCSCRRNIRPPSLLLRGALGPNIGHCGSRTTLQPLSCRSHTFLPPLARRSHQKP